MKKNEKLIKQLFKYNIVNCFNSDTELYKWISKLNTTQINNILSLNINPSLIKFDEELLINNNLLNTNDYLKRVLALTSINNAKGWYHLFDRMLSKEFINSPRFYEDIELLKQAPCAQTPLWIIGEKDFINSPYHEKDFSLLVNAKDNSERHLDFILREVIATVAGNKDSINSKYHEKDLETIIKYGSEALQSPHSYPERTITYLAINPVSLNDPYHLENMEILVHNQSIGNYLYLVMTNKDLINKPYYRDVINKMLEHQSDKEYLFTLCSYVVGLRETKLSLPISDYALIYSFKKYDYKEIREELEGKDKQTIEEVKTKDNHFKIKKMFKK